MSISNDLFCKFCSNKLKLVNNILWNAYCDHCKTSYWTANNKIKDYFFVYQEYEIHFTIDHSYSFGIRKRLKWIVQLDFIPDINPSNAKQKINSVLNLTAFQ